jgi:hypothetical protein
MWFSVLSLVGRMKLWVIAAMVSVAAGCAKKPTTIVTDVATDPNVPPLLILATNVISAADPTRRTGSERSSLGQDPDASDRPGPFFFPLRLAVTVDPSLAGPVVVEVAGLDWDTRAILAAGSAASEVIPEQDTYAAITLSAPDGGAGTDGGPDAGVD